MRPTGIKVDGYVLRKMEAVRKHLGKFGPNWDGSYIVVRQSVATHMNFEVSNNENCTSHETSRTSSLSTNK